MFPDSWSRQAEKDNFKPTKRELLKDFWMKKRSKISWWLYSIGGCSGIVLKLLWLALFVTILLIIRNVFF